TAGDLRIALRDRDRMLFVQTEQHLRSRIAEEIDETVVETAIARAGIERDVRNAERAERRRDDVTTERGFGRRDAGGTLDAAGAVPLVVHDGKEALRARRNLDQLEQLILGQRRCRVLERDRVIDDRVEPD